MMEPNSYEVSGYEKITEPASLVVSGYRCEKHGEIELEYHNVIFCWECLMDLLKDHLKPLEGEYVDVIQG